MKRTFVVPMMKPTMCSVLMHSKNCKKGRQELSSTGMKKGQ